MTSITALLLQAAISLLLFVQANPHLDASLREQAIAIANQAIKVATQQSAVPQPQTPSHPYEKPISSSSQKPVISLVYPKDGYTWYLEDQNFEFDWSTSDFGSSAIFVYLKTSDDKYIPVAQSVPNTGSYILPKLVPAPGSVVQAFTPGSYKAVVCGQFETKKTYAVCSNAATVTISSHNSDRKSITVTSPNGGEVWNPGEVHRIKWKSSGVSRVKIYIYDSNVSGSGSTNYITHNNNSVSATQGYYDWTIPLTPILNNDMGITGNNYRIRIDDADATDLAHSDSSDVPFTIGILVY